ncbi:MFS transporter [Streptomyces sp. VRA16 Mangrove soil]|uniref:MFS transporter n=1 Tax=Streptomyces sp. VRA16 Mangrove soil TaxID=2817434 RepID=UPI001A9E8533|nr:MFS transporter [Streptomyces sp. VRA16 Mangrove soil]MBO1329712.1 MFS transporter [Streptomyces sp. VRA16 Mangrove soil]
MPSRPVRPGLVLATVLVGTFMAILDVAIVNVAVPAIRTDLDAGYGGVELVISAYTITYACLLVTGGRLGDLVGRRRMFITGLLVFSAASALCGAAPNIEVLIAARALQGIGGALLYPQVLAIIQTTFEGERRGRALGTFGAVIGIASIAGQLIGGTLLALDPFGLGWRSVFLVNVPVGLAAAFAAARTLPADQPADGTRLDRGGVGLGVLALLLLSVPLLEGRDLGWPLWILLALVATAPAGYAFVRYEKRVADGGGQPLVRMELFRARGIAPGVTAAALFTASYAAYLLTLAVHLQAGLGYTPMMSALTFTPGAVGFFITSLVAPRLVPLLGKHVLTFGMVTAALGLLGAAGTVAAAGADLRWWQLAPVLFVVGLGQGFALSPLVGTVISGVPPQEAGSGAGVVTTSMQTGNVLGVALGGLVYFTVLGADHGGAASARAFAVVLPVCAALLLLGAVCVGRLPTPVGEASNAIVERLPGWASGFAYSMFLASGGRIGDRLFADVLAHVRERRLRRTQEAPESFGDFLAYHYGAQAEDDAWLAYLQREALAYAHGKVPHEDERLPVLRAQVEEVRRRQEAGRVPQDMDPELLRLLAFAVASYPRLLPQITRMVTGLNPDDPRFADRWAQFLRGLGERIETGGAVRETP